MSLLPDAVDYTDKDFDSLKLRLQNLVRSVFPEWTDYNVANFGNLLLELYAHLGDLLSFYMDNQSDQARLSTATQRKAVLGLVKLLGYTPSSASPATADVTITLPTPPAGSVTFPAGTTVLTEEITDPIEYQLLADAVIAAGANPATVTVAAENSEAQQDTVLSSGLANQVFVLTKTPYIDNSSVVLAGNGFYTQVSNFLSSGASDRHFTVSVDQNDRATVRFGNGVNGQIPVGNVTVSYKTGGGSGGRVDAGKLKRFEQTTWSDSLGNSVRPEVTNASASSGGTDRQTVAQIKQFAPQTLRALTRSVAREDFEINVLRLPSVARALMLTKNEDPGIAENAGTLFIVPVGGGSPSLELLAEALNQVTVVYPCTLTFQVTVQGALYLPVDVTAVVYMRPGFTAATVKANVTAALTAFFAIQNADGSANELVDFGAHVKDSEGNPTPEIALSDVFNAVRDATGVRKVGSASSEFLLNGVHADVTLTSPQFPTLGTVTLINGETGLTM